MCCVMKLVVKIVCFYFIVNNCNGSKLVNTNYSRVTRQINKPSCILPQHPQYGKWSIYQATSELYPGQQVPSTTILQITCQNNYKVENEVTIVCIDGKWTGKIGHCLRMCPARFNTPIMSVTCTHNEKKLENCEEAVEGTSARFKCANFYEDLSLERHPIHYCHDGKWSHNIPECTPICGKISSEASTLIIEGRNSTRGKFPWQIALYNKSDKKLLCGGSLLNQRVVVTAAHCVTDNEGKLLSKDIYMLAAGKYYRKYDHSQDLYVQYSAIYEMYIPRQYQGDLQNFFGDMAILITKETFKLSMTVQPICIDWGFNHRRLLLDPEREAITYVSGWGFTTEYKDASEVLKELQVPLVSREDCIKNLDYDYRQFLTDDKLCAGFINASKAACLGDSGGGLVTTYGNRFYLIGLVSLSPQAPNAEISCSSQDYTLYTDVHYYVNNFILDKEAQFRPSTSGNVDCENDPNCKSTISTIPPPVSQFAKDTCILPQHPAFGKWSIFGVASLPPGADVSSGTILRISCNNGYKLSGTDVILCDKGLWSAEITECLKPCPPIQSSHTVEVSCTLKNKKLKDCSNPLDGTIARQKCAPFYEDLQLTKNPVRVCRNGSWDNTIPECVPICGLKSVTAQPLIINGNTVKKGQYPWQVALYHGPNKEFICGGVLISQKLILTAAQCVSNWTGQLQPKENYEVAVGKFYREYSDPLDQNAQYSKLEDIFVPLRYAGKQNNYIGDIAVLVTKNLLVLSSRVQPACVDWGLNYITANTSENLKGYVSGWGLIGSVSTPSNTLRDLEVPVVEPEKCLKHLPEDFQVYVTTDTFCAGYLNQNKSVCRGDVGGGFVTNYDGRYYVTGIISRVPILPQENCDGGQYAIYTKVSDYNNFITEKEAKIKTPSKRSTNCQDNEDSSSCQTTTAKPISTTPKPVTQGSNCILPQYPAFGTWSLYGTSRTNKSPGGTAADGTILQVTCENSYKLEGDSVILCEQGKWSANIGKCLKTCPTPLSTSVVKALCIGRGQLSENCTDPIHGTRVKYECAPFYEDPQLAQNPIHLCQNGKWSHSPPECVPVCGQKTVTAQVLIVSGNSVTKGDYPWQVAIYTTKKKELLCTGTLISERIILTVAHCVTDYLTGNILPKENYIAAVGKYYRRYNDTRDMNEAQFSTLQDIFTPEEYNGELQNYLGDIAILVVQKKFVFSRRVQPACYDSRNKFEMHDQDFGYVTGFGFTAESSKPSDVLQELKIPFVKKSTCRKNLPEDYLPFLTHDKFCAGYLDEGIAICTGDSGSGIVFKHDDRYFITGIVSIGVASPSSGGGCDSNQYSLYTNVSKYMNSFILPKVAQYKS